MTPSPPTAREVLESTREEVDRMSRIVDNLLTLARVDEGRLELLTTHVDLAEAIEAAVRPLRPLAAAKGLRLEVNGERCEVAGRPAAAASGTDELHRERDQVLRARR